MLLRKVVAVSVLLALVACGQGSTATGDQEPDSVPTGQTSAPTGSAASQPTTSSGDTIPCADVPVEWFEPLRIDVFVADLYECQSLTSMGSDQLDSLLVSVSSDVYEASDDQILTEIERLRSTDSPPPDQWMLDEAAWEEYVQIETHIDHFVFNQKVAFGLSDSDLAITPESASFAKGSSAGGTVVNETHHAIWFAAVLYPERPLELTVGHATAITDTLKRRLLGTPILEQLEYGPPLSTPGITTVAEGFGHVTVSGAPLPALTPGSTPDPADRLPAPSLAGTGLDGSMVSIEPDGRAKVVVFLAHWCPHCHAAVTQAGEWLAAGNKPDEVDFYAVSTLADPSRESWPPVEWLTAEGWTVATIQDDQDSTAGAAFGVESIPLWVVLDNDNVVVERRSGEVGPGGLNELFEAAVAK